MTVKKHIIKNQVIELGIPSSVNARQIQDTVSRIYNENIVPVIENCCNEVGSSNIVYRFDSLYLDVGSIPLGELETEFPARTEARLKDLINVKTGRIESEDKTAGIHVKGVEKIPAYVSRRELFDYFINTGTMPWWADQMDSAGIEDNLKRLVAESPDELADIIIRCISDTSKLKRLVYQFSDHNLLSITKAILRKFNPAIRRFFPVFIEAFLIADIRVKNSRNEVRLALWSDFFSHIVNIRKYRSDLPGLSRELLISLSRRLGVPYQELARFIRQAAGKLGENGLHLKEVLSAVVTGTLPGGKGDNTDLQKMPASTQLNGKLSNEEKDSMPVYEQEHVLRKLELLLTQIRRKLRIKSNEQKVVPEGVIGLFEKAIESFLMLIEAGDFIDRPAKQFVRKSEFAVTRNNRVPVTSQRIVRKSEIERSLSMKQHIQQLENIINKSSGNGISSECKVWLEELIKGLHSLEGRVLPAENIKLLQRLEVLVHNLPHKKNLTGSKNITEDILNEKSLKTSGGTTDITLEKENIFRRQKAVNDLSNGNTPSKSRRQSVRVKTKGKSHIMPVGISGITPEDGSLSRGQELSGNQLLNKNSVSDLKKYPNMHKFNKESLHVQDRLIVTKVGEENLLRQAETIFIALRRDIISSYPSLRLEKTTSNNKGSKSRKKLLSGDIVKEELYEEYKKILGLLEQLLSLSQPEKQVVNRFESEICTLLDKKKFSESQDQLRELQRELSAALRIIRRNIRLRKDVKVRSQESEKALSDYTSTTKQLDIKYSKTQANSLAENLRDVGLPNVEHRDEFTEENEEVPIKGKGARAKTASNLTNDDFYHIEFERNNQGSEKYKVSSEREQKYQPGHKLYSSKQNMLNDRIPDIQANTWITPTPRTAGDLEDDTQGIIYHEAGKVGGFNEAVYHSSIGKREVERRYSISDRNESIDDSNELFIRNSGLVILWPFLSRFFENVGLVKEGFFISSGASERAVHLLQYIADGSLETPEHELPLNKVLCGRKLAEPVVRDFEIFEKESLESDNLIKSVIQNWPALGNISIDGFRVSFLQRRGLLMLCNGDWLVQVERQTHDILLDKLGWTINVIRLPWLDNIIFTEW